MNTAFDRMLGSLEGWTTTDFLVTFLAYQSYTRIIRGAWKLTVTGTKLVTGPESPNLECLVVIPTGVALFVGNFPPFVRNTPPMKPSQG